MEINKKILAAIASSALIFNAFATSAFAATTIIISGNGANTENDAQVEIEREVEVVQSNVADVLNEIDVDADTGDNEAEDNLGGEVSIDTGDVTTKVNVTNTLNSNHTEVECCPNGDINAEISGNLSGSDNWLDLDLENETDIEQFNVANVENDVDVDGDTGDNEAEDNSGDITIKTGSVTTDVSISTVANANSAVLAGDGEGGSLEALITGNGADTENDVELDLDNNVWLDQTNFADVLNEVDVDGDTGDNEAEDNLGGEVMIDTGDVDTEVDVNNVANFNFADLDCGCLLEDILAKVSGNLADSENEINAEIEDETDVEQFNELDCVGNDQCSDVDVDGDTGDNDVEGNGGANDDPSIETGDADADVNVNNSGNVNVFGDTDFDLPEFDFDLSIDLGDLLDWLMSQV